MRALSFQTMVPMRDSTLGSTRLSPAGKWRPALPGNPAPDAPWDRGG